MSLSVTICVPVAPPALVGRVLASCVVARKRDAHGWISRNAETWRGALFPGEPSFVAWIHDADGEAIQTLEHPRDWAAPVVKHGRETLRALKATRPRTKKTPKKETT